MTRVLSGVVLAAAGLAAILFLPFVALRVLVCAIAGLAADEYLRITARRRDVVRWIVIAAVIYTCWWAAVPAPLSIVLLSMIVVAWLALAVLRQGRTVQEAAVDLVAPL
jgi:CDP-diglyceride synthetase